MHEISYGCTPELQDMYKLSPFVWRGNDRFDLLLRVVNRDADASRKVARVHYGRSSDGVHFELEPVPVIAPDPAADAYDNGGCEDPTLAIVGSTRYVYYSGWNEHFKKGELLLPLETKSIDWLSAASLSRLRRPRIIPKKLKSSRWPTAAGGSSSSTPQNNQSKIAIARSANVDGPWDILPPLFAARTETWDAFHLSTGPVISSNPDFPVMFFTTERRVRRSGAWDGSSSMRHTLASLPGQSIRSFCLTLSAIMTTPISHSRLPRSKSMTLSTSTIQSPINTSCAPKFSACDPVASRRRLFATLPSPEHGEQLVSPGRGHGCGVEVTEGFLRGPHLLQTTGASVADQ